MKNTLALSATAVALLLAPVARADVIKLNVSATLTPDNGDSLCTPTCTLGGDVVINNSAPGEFISADITATGFSPSVGPFTTSLTISPSGGETNLGVSDSSGDTVFLFISTLTAGSVVGYAGGPITASLLGPFGDAGLPTSWSGSGSLTAAAVIPEPSTWALMALGFAGLGLAGWRSRRQSVSIAA